MTLLVIPFFIVFLASFWRDEKNDIIDIFEPRLILKCRTTKQLLLPNYL